MLGRPVDISVPNALALPLAEAVDAVGTGRGGGHRRRHPARRRHGGDRRPALPDADAATLCGLLGVEAGTEVGLSALGEIGNILGASYVGALGAMTGLELEPTPPQTVTDMLAAIVSTVLAANADRDRHGADPRLRAGRRGRGVLAVVPHAARPRAASTSCWPAWAWHDDDVRDHGAHGRDRGLGDAGRRARVDRPGLVHRAGARRPAARHRRAGARHAARGARPRRPSRASSPTSRCPRSSSASSPWAASRGTLKAVIVGGAQMFSLERQAGTLDIGVRNEAAVRGLLAGRADPDRRRGHARLQGPHHQGLDRAAPWSARRPAGPRSSFSRGRADERRERTVLSPEQIAALVEAAKNGELQDDAPRRAATRRAPRLRTVNFARPTKFTSDQERRLGRSLESFCRTASTRLSAELRVPIEFEVIASSQLTWSSARRPAAEQLGLRASSTSSRSRPACVLGAELPFVLVRPRRAARRRAGPAAQGPPPDRDRLGAVAPAVHDHARPAVADLEGRRRRRAARSARSRRRPRTRRSRRSASRPCR